ncbi:MAG: DUF4129 domain-containing protein, partial [Actinomycetota bacterium]|nr:DUF4129 domain-containing protein [Actinomycetota bacterium]
LRRRPVRYLLALAAIGVLAFGVVGGALAADQQRAADAERSASRGSGEIVRSVEDAPEAPAAEPQAAVESAPPGEWLAAAVSIFAALIVIALLASNWFREQPLEFKPAEATPGDGGAMITDSVIDDPFAVVVSTEDATTVIDRALVAIEDVPDPRQAIRLAYALVEEGFGDLEARRLATESEIEYLHRLLPALGGATDAMRELTSLFEQARFSPHDITEPMRRAALSALATVRSDLSTEATGAVQS